MRDLLIASFVGLPAAGLVMQVWYTLRLKAFLAETTVIRRKADLDEFRRFAVGKVALSALHIVLITVAILGCFYGMIKRHLWGSDVFYLIVSAELLSIWTRYMWRVVRRLKELPAEGEDLKEERDRIVEKRLETGLPESCTDMLICRTGFYAALAAMMFVRHYRPWYTDRVETTILVMTTLAWPILFFEFVFLKNHRRPSSGLDVERPPDFDFVRVLVKIIGFAFTVGVFAFAYWVFPEYHRSFYNPYWDLLGRLIWPVVIGVPIYFFIVDMYMKNPRDGYWHAGLLALGFLSKCDRGVLKQHFLGWTVKAFFVPLMFIWLSNSIAFFQNMTIPPNPHPKYWFDVTLRFIYGVDLVYVAIGYILSMRVFDTHLRSAEPTILGWCVALACYPPFWDTLVGNRYIIYGNGYEWYHWLKPHTLPYDLWALAILFFTAVYSYATIPFGLRFSNLTHRGILTNGPYRWSKHPAYFSKNLTWWLIAVPFITAPNQHWTDAVRLCFMLCLLNFIYFMRAKTEEWHLSKDPVFVEYAVAMNEKSWFAWLGRIFPVLQYRPPKSKA